MSVCIAFASHLRLPSRCLSSMAPNSTPQQISGGREIKKPIYDEELSNSILLFELAGFWFFWVSKKIEEREANGPTQIGRLLLVLERGAFEVCDHIGDSALDELDFVGDGTTFGNGCSGLGLAMAVYVGCSSGSSRSASGLFSLQAIEILLGLGDVLVDVS